MYIISKFHDYYDSSCAFGIDKTIIYKRKSEESPIGYTSVPYTYENKGVLYDMPTNVHNLYKTMAYGRMNNYNIRKFIIGFCGDFYPGYAMSCNYKPYVICWNSSDIIRFFLTNKLDDEYNSFVESRSSKDVINRHRGHRYTSHTIWQQDVAHTWNTNIAPDDTEFHKYKTPIIVYQQSTELGNTDLVRIINPMLKQYAFARMADPFTAFQEIQMYISGVLGTNENDMVQISDTDMRDAKGHDNMSFKKYPTKR